MSGKKSDVDNQWFMNRIVEGWGSLRKFAPVVGMDASALSRTLNGERRMQMNEGRKIAELFGVPYAEVAAHVDSSNNLRTGKAPARRDAEGFRKNSNPEAEPKPVSSGFMEAQVAFKNDKSSKDGEYVVPPQGEDPLFGCMAGTLTLLPDVDYTAPADPDWGKVYDD